MDPSMLDAAGQALVTIMDPYRLMLLGAGVVMGLVLGILPGIGGLAGTALLLPVTFNMDPYAAFALLHPCGVPLQIDIEVAAQACVIEHDPTGGRSKGADELTARDGISSEHRWCLTQATDRPYGDGIGWRPLRSGRRSTRPRGGAARLAIDRRRSQARGEPPVIAIKHEIVRGNLACLAVCLQLEALGQQRAHHLT